MDGSKTAFIGLGSNLGDKFEFIKSAVSLINNSQKNRVDKISSIYESYPLGETSQENYLNAVIKISTSLSPEELFHFLKEIEGQLGRKKSKKWDSREIDLDILFYDDQVIKTDLITIPHQQICERDFVLFPMHEIEPGLIHPVFNQKICDICNKDLQKFVFAVCKKKLIISEGEIEEVENGN